MTLKIFPLVITLMILNFECAAQMITTCTDLQNMVNNLSGNYSLANDIDCSATTTWNAGAGLVPIGNSTYPFTGILNGAGHKIYNLTINRPSTSYVALFGCASSTVQIMQISLIGVTIHGYNYVGGLVGYSNCTISNAQTTGNIFALTGGSYIGGLVGYNNGATITQCYSANTVSANYYYIGGLVGYNSGTILSSYATGSASGYYVGGLVGYNTGTITNTYATGSVAGSTSVGSLVGYNIGTITNSYAIGPVASGNGGGLVGWGPANIGGVFMYSTGGVYSSYWDMQTTGLTMSIGGVAETTIALYHNATYLHWDFNCVWSINEGIGRPQLTQNNCPSPPITQVQISNCNELQLTMFLYTADITLTQDIDCTATTTWNNGAGFYPGMLTSGSFNGLGYRIINLMINRFSSQIGLFGQTSNGVQINDVILDGNTISGYANVGSLVGYNGGTITNCYATGSVTGLSGSNYVGGLTGYNYGSVINSYSTGEVSGSNYVGGLIGYNYGSSATIIQCYTTGSVSGLLNAYYIGGLVGYQASGIIIQSYSTSNVSGITGIGYYIGGLAGVSAGSITSSYATGNISGSMYIGGLVGESFGGTISNSYATGGISGGSYVGGLVGFNDGTITNCYSIGDVTGLGSLIGGLAGTSNFAAICAYWDTLTSNQASSSTGVGLPTQAMQQATSYVGWDFTATWVISAGYSYPLLQAFIAPPTLSNPLNNITRYVGSLFEFTIPANTFTDPNGLRLTYSAELVDGSPLPAWLIFKPLTQTFVGTPLSGAQAILMIQVSVYNLPSLSISDTWQLTIPNRPPIINTPLLPQVAFNGQPFQFIVPTVTFFDADGDRLQLSAVLQNTTSLPSWLNFNAALNILFGTAMQRGNTWINVTANDGFGGQVSTLLEIITPNTNPTTTATFSNQVVLIGQSFNFAIPTNIFFDLDGDPLIYYATLFGGGALLPWLNFNAQTLTFQGIPNAPGFLMVSVTATDPYNASKTLNFGISVSAASSNSPPLVAIPISDQTTTVGQPFELALPENTFVDPEGNPLTYTAMLEGGASLPSWLDFNSTSLFFSGTPPTTSHLPVTVRADDGLGGFALNTFTLTIISNQKLPPLLQNPISNQVATVGENYRFVIPSNTFIEVNDAVLTYTAMTMPNGRLPGWLQFDPNTRTFAGRPSNTDTNIYSDRLTMVEVRANNEVGSASSTFQLSVTGTSRAEVVINTLITLASIASTAFGVYRNRAFLWNTFLKKKYEKQTKTIALNEPFTFQFTVPHKQIKRVKAMNKVSSKQIHKKYWKSLNCFNFNPYQELADKHRLPDWLKFDPSTLILSGTTTEPGDFYICAEGFDGRYLEAFKLHCETPREKKIELQQV